MTDSVVSGDSPTVSPLVNSRKIRVPKLPTEAQKISETNVEFRYRLQDVAREILSAKDERLRNCLKRIAPMSATVEVRRNVTAGTAHFRGLEQCSRVWTCPCCAQRISARRRDELTQAIAASKLLGFSMAMVTYTLRHDGSETLEQLLEGLQESLRRFKSGRGFQDIKDEYGIVGSVKTLEMTYGENGWHPHVHELVFFDGELPRGAVGGLEKWLKSRWLGSLQKLGCNASWEYGCHVETANSKIADYIAKWGCEPKEREFGVETELTGSNTKKASRDGLTPFQLLECYDVGDFHAAALYEEYAAAMEGKRQLVWAKGTRALLKMPDELPDEQLSMLEEVPQVFTAVELGSEAWRLILLYQLRGRLLALVAAGDWDRLRVLLFQHQIRARIATEPPADEMTIIPPVPAVVSNMLASVPGSAEHIAPVLPGFAKTEYR